MNVSNLANLFRQNSIFQQNKPLGQKLVQPLINDTLYRLSQNLVTAQKQGQDLRKRFDTLELSTEATSKKADSALSEMPDEMLDLYMNQYKVAAYVGQQNEAALLEYRNQLSAFDQTIQEYQDMLDGNEALPEQMKLEDVSKLLDATKAARTQFLQEGAETFNRVGRESILDEKAFQMVASDENSSLGDFQWSIDPSSEDIYAEIDHALVSTHEMTSMCKDGASRFLSELKRRGAANQPWHRLSDDWQGGIVGRSGIYKPSSGQMQAIGSPSYTWAVPDSRLQAEILPPSEQSSYTAEDALINQYMKQSRIDGYLDGDTFVRTSSEPVKLILKSDISKTDLEKFNRELAQKGLGEEIDWRGVQEDFVQIGVGFDNIERFEQKADYLASRYAVLKDRIQTQFTGERQESELQKLEQIYTQAKEEMANSYAKSIGGFFEGLGQSGAAADMRSSVLALVDQKASAYTDYIGKAGVYASITDPNKQWLKQDDAYMAAQLRQSAAASLGELQRQSVNEQAPYDGNDLSFAGIYAKNLFQQLQRPTWNVNESDTALGQHLAAQYGTLKNSAGDAGISEKLSNMLNSSFDPFMNRLMDSLDALIDRNRGWVAEKPWMSGTIRTDYIDRESVYQSFQNAISKA